MKKCAINFLATGGYVGLSPVMPGTIGTLWGIPIAWGLSFLSLPLAGIVIVALTLLSIYVAGEAQKISGKKDPGSIVCDEVAGFLVAVYLVPVTPATMIAAFILFRFFDIAKPFPIGIIDKRIGGGFGVVADDLAAGVLTNIVLQLAIILLPQWV